MGRHQGPPSVFDAIVDDYATSRAKELVRQFDAWISGGANPAPVELQQWIGSAAEILRELTRDA
jgi:hypothetical protein